jgi:hypothetical protein
VEEVPATPGEMARVHSQLTMNLPAKEAAAPQMNPSSPDFVRRFSSSVSVSSARDDAPLPPPSPHVFNPAASSSATPPLEMGSAFDGRLTYNLVRRNSDGFPLNHQAGSRDRQSVGSAPAAAVVDYQFLRLKFLLNKVPMLSQCEFLS